MLSIPSLARVRRNLPQARGEQGVRGQVHRPVFDRVAWRVVGGAIVALVVAGRANRPRAETAAAIRTDVLQQGHAGGAEGAFETADAGVLGRRGQGLVAVFTAGAQFEHGGYPGSGNRRYKPAAPGLPSAGPSSVGAAPDQAALP